MIRQVRYFASRITPHRFSFLLTSALLIGLIANRVVAETQTAETSDLPALTTSPATEVSHIPPTEVVAETAAEEHSLRRKDALLASVTIFVLAVFLGFELITKVPPTLHTPLMSGSNAISGITLVGAVLTAGAGHSAVGAFLGLLAVILATVNVVGGFLVTDRMLEMFQKKK
jgi:NAD(P) transhydrogenase subunit alpha